MRVDYSKSVKIGTANLGKFDMNEKKPIAKDPCDDFCKKFTESDRLFPLRDAIFYQSVLLRNG